ncbi:hypothetical protein HD806DRAFT_541055 [Xylariaceae sp. AK1471]|nr:hypothetical protein HD806DRAFT_541055 [Xylariaceae sp. AK1471]
MSSNDYNDEEISCLRGTLGGTVQIHDAARTTTGSRRIMVRPHDIPAKSRIAKAAARVHTTLDQNSSSAGDIVTCIPMPSSGSVRKIQVWVYRIVVGFLFNVGSLFGFEDTERMPAWEPSWKDLYDFIFPPSGDAILAGAPVLPHNDAVLAAVAAVVLVVVVVVVALASFHIDGIPSS